MNTRRTYALLTIVGCLSATALLLPGCEGAQNALLQETEKQVMAIHDEVMPKMGYAESLRTSVLSLRDSLIAAKAPAAAKADSCVRLLDSARVHMDTWMERYDPNYLKNLDAAGALAYISGQLTQVVAMKAEFASALLSSEQLLTEFKRAVPAAPATKPEGAHEGHH